MSLSPPKSAVILKRTVALAIALGAMAGGYAYLRVVMHIDPFADKRRAANTVHPGIEIPNATITHYSGTKLVTKAHVDSLTVRDDRQLIEGNGVKGQYFNEKGKPPVNFEAGKVTWYPPNKTLEATGGTHVWDSKSNVVAPMFRFNSGSGLISVPGAIQGRIGGGFVQTTNLTYDTKRKKWKAGPGNYDGPLAIRLKQDSAAQKSDWHIKWDGNPEGSEDVTIFPNATATDGEVIVQASRVERNGKTDVITATGKVYYFSPESNLVCDKAVVYHKEHRAILTGNVTMLVKPKDQQTKASVEPIASFRPMSPDQLGDGVPPPALTDVEKDLDEEVRSTKTIRKYPIAIGTQEIEYWYGKGSRHAIITGNPQARQETSSGRWRHIWAVKGLYDGEADTMRLEGPVGQGEVRLKNSIGDDYNTDWFGMSTKDEKYNDWKAGPGKGRFRADRSEIPAREKPAEPPKADSKGGKGDGKSSPTPAQAAKGAPGKADPKKGPPTKSGTSGLN